ncbi:MAG: DUF5713 family protein [Rufibacter sp.]
MKKSILIIFSISLKACNSKPISQKQSASIEMLQDSIKNEQIKNHEFLADMYQDDYFPDFLVDKGKAILMELCLQIENQKPKNAEELYVLTHASTYKFNDLSEEFYENDSELETAARESIAADFEFIAKAYGFEADTEELIAARDW